MDSVSFFAAIKEILGNLLLIRRFFLDIIALIDDRRV